jgi:VWFA-related protein
MTPLRAAIVASIALLAPEQTVFKTRVDAVRVDVLVTRGGRPVAGLTAADFELRDSGVAQRVEAVSLEEIPLNLLLALDMSGSMADAPLRHLKDAAHAAVANLSATDRASVLTFSHVIQKRIDWSSDTAAVGRAIDSLESIGSTSLADAAYAALTMRESADGRMLVLLFTDGLDTASWLDPLAVIEAARRSDVVVVAVRLESALASRPVSIFRDTRTPAPPAAVRHWFEQEPQLLRDRFLPTLAGESGGDLIVASQSGDLHAVFAKIVAEFKMRYVLSYSPQNVAPSGWHPIDVTLKGKKGEVRARRGYAR